MADNNTYTSKQNIKKYTTQAKFDAIDKSDVPVGTEYNIVGSITESDLDSDLQAKVNESVTGDGLTTEVTDGKVKVKNPMTFEGQRGVELNSTNLGSAYSTGTTYVFPNSTPLGQDYVNGHFPIGIVPIIGATDSYIIDNTSATTTYQGIFLPNAYDSNNYDVNAYAMITMTRSNNSGNQIYILPYCGSNPGVSYLLNQESIQAGSGSNMSIYRDNEGKVWLSAEVPSSSAILPEPPSSAGTEAVLTSYAAQSGAAEIVWKTPEDTDIFANVLVKTIDRFGLYMTDPKTLSKRTIAAFDWDAKDQGSGVSSYILMTPDMPNLSGFETGGRITHTLPDKSGTLATTDEVQEGVGKAVYKVTATGSIGQYGNLAVGFTMTVPFGPEEIIKRIIAIDLTPNSDINHYVYILYPQVYHNRPDADGQYVIFTYAHGGLTVTGIATVHFTFVVNDDGTYTYTCSNFENDTFGAARATGTDGTKFRYYWGSEQGYQLNESSSTTDEETQVSLRSTKLSFHNYDTTKEDYVEYDVLFPTKGGTLALLDDIPTGGTTYTAGKNIEISGTTIAVVSSPTFDEVNVGNANQTTGTYIGQGYLELRENSLVALYPDALYFCPDATDFKNGASLKQGVSTGNIDVYLPSGSGTLTNSSDFKTLFGNQNIVGSGNIDLYQHIITILLNDGTKTAAIIVSKISSSNLQVDSLTDLKTLFGATFTYPCSGAVYNTDGSGNATAAVTISDVDVRYISGGTIASFSYASATTMQFVDTVTTV